MLRLHVHLDMDWASVCHVATEIMGWEAAQEDIFTIRDSDEQLLPARQTLRDSGVGYQDAFYLRREALMEEHSRARWLLNQMDEAAVRIEIAASCARRLLW